MNKQIILFTLTILILIGIICAITTIKILPSINQYKNYIISGIILPAENVVGNKPNSIYVYYPYYIPNYICSGMRIQQSDIYWSNESNGKYEILITIPLGLKEILITTDCASCDAKKITLNNNTESVDLTWGDNQCDNRFQLSDDRIEVVKHTRGFLNAIETNIANKPYNTTELQSIKQDVGRGHEAIAESDGLTDVNESLLYAYYAEWFSWRAEYKIRLFDLKYCVENANELIRFYENDKCYVPENNAYNDYSSSNSSFFYLSKNSLLEDYPFSIKEINRIKNEISYLNNQADWVYESLRRCEDSLSVINGTFEFQKPYCETRQNVNHVTIIVWIITGVFIGIVIEKGRKIWKK